MRQERQAHIIQPKLSLDSTKTILKPHVCGRGSVSPGSSLLAEPEGSALHKGGTPALDSYRHAIERELSVDFKLIRCRQPPAGIQQDIVELEVQAEVCKLNGSLLPPMSSQGGGRGLASGPSLPTGNMVLGLPRTKRLAALTRKNMRCCSPFPESLLRLPRRMNSCRADRGQLTERPGVSVVPGFWPPQPSPCPLTVQH